MQRLLLVPFVLSLGLGVVRADNQGTQPPQYEVFRTESSPTIDGLVGEGEWDGAAPAAGNWVGIASGAVDEANWRFRMLWDDQNLYVLGETDYTRDTDRGWAGYNPLKDFLTNNPELDDEVVTPRMIFDPNADREDWSSPDFNPAEPDGYSILWSLGEDFTARRPTPEQPARPLRDPLLNADGDLVDYIVGFELEANVNSLSGNNGGWDTTVEGEENYRDDKHPGIQLAQLGINDPLDETESPGAVFEFAIAWSSFNATDPESGNPLFNPEAPEFLENGLYHPTAPEAGDVWGFEIGVKDPEGTLPSWSEPAGGSEPRETFADWHAPHGRLLFNVKFPEFDCNRSGDVELGDLDCMTTATRDGTLNTLSLALGDFGADGAINLDDFNRWASNAGNAETTYSQGDLTLDGNTDQADINAWADLASVEVKEEAAAAVRADVTAGGSVYDFDGSGMTDLADLVAARDFLGITVFADCDASGVLDAPDLGCVSTVEERDAVLEATELALGDFSTDGELNVADFTLLAGNLGADTTYTQGDLDLSGSTDAADIAGWANLADDALKQQVVSAVNADLQAGGSAYDINGNGATDAGDLLLARRFLGVTAVLGDCDSSGGLDAADLACVSTLEERDAVLAAANLLVGDFNADGVVNFPDFLRLAAVFNQQVESYTQGDANLDGVVTFPDFLALAANFNKRSPELAAVPEPSAMALLLIGVLALRRKRRR